MNAVCNHSKVVHTHYLVIWLINRARFNITPNILFRGRF